MKSVRGFTLIEVLVALLVFSLIASIAAKRSSQYILSYERVRDKTFASWIADNRISELRLQEKLPDISETRSDIEFGAWKCRLENTGAMKTTRHPPNH